MNFILTTGFPDGDLARTIGNANAETMKPIVIKIADSRQGPPDPPESSEYRLATRVGMGAKRYRSTTKKGHHTLQSVENIQNIYHY